MFVLSMLLFLSVVLSACDHDASDEYGTSGGAEFDLIGKSESTTSYGRPSLYLTVKNVGSDIGYNVACRAYAKKADTIVDSAFAYFLNGADIAPGEKATDEAIFFKIESLTGYTLEYQITWLDR